MRILLAEDNSEDATTLKRTLVGSQYAWEIKVVETLHEAIFLAPEYDAVGFDLGLPKSSTAEVLKSAKELSSSNLVFIYSGTENLALVEDACGDGLAFIAKTKAECVASLKVTFVAQMRLLKYIRKIQSANSVQVNVGGQGTLILTGLLVVLILLAVVVLFVATISFFR